MRPNLQREGPHDRRRPSQTSAVRAVPRRTQAGRRSNSHSTGEEAPDVPFGVRRSTRAVVISGERSALEVASCILE